MHCIILLPDCAGRLPTAQELRQSGFAVSEAVLESGSRAGQRTGPGLEAAASTVEGAPGAQSALALAAETPARYGRPPEG